MIVPETAMASGFVNEPVGTHSSRTIMVPELTALLAAAPSPAPYAELRALVVNANICGKATISGRREVFRRLAELYSFRREVPIYSVFRDLWDLADADHPLLAILLASARDPLLRATAPGVLRLTPGEPITPHEQSADIDLAYPSRYGPKISASVGRHTIASWRQSGHLIGRRHKTRARAHAGPAACAYALWLGHLCGARGLRLYETLWVSILDADTGDVDRLAFAAAQRGWLEYRRMGDVADFGFERFEASARGSF